MSPTWPLSRRAAIEVAVSALCLALAALLVLVMVQVRPWQRAITRGDARFNAIAPIGPDQFAAPPAPLARWDVPRGFAARIAERLLGLQDDLAYRQAVALYRAVSPNPNEQIQNQDDPELPARRILAQQALTAVSKDDPNAQRRSQATNMLGILVRSGPTPVDPSELRTQILTAIALFKTAIRFDPENADAKLNLELVLQDPQTQEFVGTEPTGNPDAGNRAGAGSAGHGY